jgi:hypothetical protein
MAGSVGHRLDGLRARRILGGLSVYALAKQANLSDRLIEQLENGNPCRPEVTARIMAVLAPPVALTSNSQVNPTVFTVAAHSFQTGDTVIIAGVVGANADPNGTRVVTRINGTTFSVPVDCSVAGGTGGTATATTASIGLAGL